MKLARSMMDYYNKRMAVLSVGQDKIEEEEEADDKKKD